MIFGRLEGVERSSGREEPEDLASQRACSYSTEKGMMGPPPWDWTHCAILGSHLFFLRMKSLRERFTR